MIGYNHSEAALQSAWQEAILDGGGPLGVGRLNIVGQGRAGKTAFARQLEGLCFQDTASTRGVAQRLLEVTRSALDVGDGDRAWRRAVGCDESGAISAEQAAARLVAQKLTAVQGGSGAFQATQYDEGIPELVENISEVPQQRPAEQERAIAPINRDLVLEMARTNGAEAVGLRLSLWDFGGQEEFYVLHHLYLTRFATYAVLFNMEVCCAYHPYWAFHCFQHIFLSIFRPELVHHLSGMIILAHLASGRLG